MRALIIEEPRKCPYNTELCPVPDDLRASGRLFYCRLKVREIMKNNGWQRASSHQYWLMECESSYPDNGQFPDFCPLISVAEQAQKGQEADQ